jgi:16S rRNA (guanine527-N7)-methyltransferase
MLDHANDQSIFRAALQEAAASIGLAVSEAHVLTMWRHFAAMVRQNEVMNLTRITDPAEAAVKHYADSLALGAWVAKENVQIRSVLDVGTGAGFPAVPLAIVQADWQITAIDGTRKKVDFVRQCAAELGLSNLRAEHAHANHWKTSQRFDVVTLRAVCKLDEAIEMCARFVRHPGWLLVYKTAQVEEAERDSGIAVARAAGMAESVFQYELSDRGEALRRSLFAYKSCKR